MTPTTTDLLRPPLPTRLQVEVTAACNLRCRMCIVRYAPAKPRSAAVSLPALVELLDQMPGLTHLALQGIGEPLLTPDLTEMVAEASHRGIVVDFNTNATLLTRRAAESLLDAGLATLHISLDGATKETYEFIRDGARWETVTRNISDFMALKRERNAGRPHVGLAMVLMRRNLHELPALVELAARWGIPEVWTQNLSHDFSDAPRAAYEAIATFVNAESALTLPADELEAAYAAARAAAQREGVRLRLPHYEDTTALPTVDGTPVGCTWPWDSAYVAQDGRVQPCCMVMGADRVDLGNTSERPFVEIWHGDAFQQFRQGLLNGDPHPVCRGCTMYRGKF